LPSNEYYQFPTALSSYHYPTKKIFWLVKENILFLKKDFMCYNNITDGNYIVGGDYGFSHGKRKVVLTSI